MNISAPFIERPVMTVLLMIALVAFGAFGYSALPVSELPAVDFPTINVSASLPGADPADHGVARWRRRWKAQFSTIAGVSSMTSQSSSGTTSVTIQFDLDRNIDGAAEDVQAAIQAGGAAAAGQHAVPAYPAQSQSGGRADPVPGDAVGLHAAL